jgi:hypothetical protein
MTVSRAVSRDEVSKVVASQLGPSYPVRLVRNPHSFAVGRGMLQARVRVVTDDRTTTIEVIPFGFTLFRAINSAGIVPKVETALRQSELRAA